MTLIGMPDAAKRAGMTPDGLRRSLMNAGVPLVRINARALAVEESVLAAFIEKRGKNPGAGSASRRQEQAEGGGAAVKRDMELVRKILLAVEALPAYQALTGPEQANLRCDPADFFHHVGILAGAGYLEANSITNGMGMTAHYPEALTWDGHELLDDIRDDTVWNKTKEAVGDKMTTVSVAVLQEVAKVVARSLLGLP